MKEDIRVSRVKDAKNYILSIIGDFRPTVGIVLGSGLGKLGADIQNPIVVPYKDIPGFPVSTAIGHKGNFIFGQIGGRNVIAMQGRFHYYEGYNMGIVPIGIGVMCSLGAKFLFVSNAAGACNETYEIGDLVIIRDHINLLPNPLIGQNLDQYGPRFPDMTCAYDLELQELGAKACAELGLPVKKGVYLGSTGPTYETPAEVRFFRAAGADLLGMSTIPEVIAARFCGLRVFGMSVVTNKSNTDNVSTILNDGDDVIKQADLAADRMSAIFKKVIESI